MSEPVDPKPAAARSPLSRVAERRGGTTSNDRPDREHRYAVRLDWTGNLGSGTSGYRSYSRNHLLGSGDKPTIAGSADAAFRGDRDRWNPEELLVGALAQCHMLWFLDLATRRRVIVVDYADEATGRMLEHYDGSGEFVEVTLRPTVTIAAGGSVDVVESLHQGVHGLCFIARSVSFPVRVEARTIVEDLPS